MSALLATHRARGLLLALLLAALAACEASGPFVPIDRGVAGTNGGADPISSELVGRWVHTLVFLDEFGFLHSTETTWEFDAAGTAVRTIVTTNQTLGISDVTVTTARWRVENARLVIEFLSPDSGEITLDFFFSDGKLILAGQTFNRVSG
ncbi:MAG TPA: hypothetical protein VF178_05155 [Gemmatimonadaceae bacterium]